MNIKLTLGAISIVAALALSGCGSSSSSTSGTTPISEIKDSTEIATVKKAALTAYADYAINSYAAALSDAEKLKTALTAFTSSPTDSTMTAAKDAWVQSRETYGVTEILRLSEGPIDAEEGFAATFGAPEGQLNAWPLNESLIDSVTLADGTKTSGNIIDNATSPLATFTGQDASTVALGENGDQSVDISTINIAMLKDFTAKDGDANVATGYHAIEFLLWGQDQDYSSMVADNITHGATTAGQRPVTDYTTDAGAERRKAYLLATADLIIEDLKLMTAAWDKSTGTYRKAFIGEGAKKIAADTALTNVFKGMGVFLKSELAQERISVAALNPSEEDEHSCFSDNTHRDIALNYKGFHDVLNDVFVPNLTSTTKTKIADGIAKVDAGVKQIDDLAKSKMHFDYQIADATQSAKVVATKNYMRDLADLMVVVAKEYGITITKDDVTDGEESADSEQGN